MNVGVLTSRRTKESDETYTPYYAVTPLLQFIKDYAREREGIVTVWCPFDKEWSAYVQTFKENGIKVIHSHLDEGQDFFEYEPSEDYDVIISNPPFSLKDQVLKRLSELGKPYAILLPINSLQGVKRFKDMKDTQLLWFDSRIGFHNKDSMTVPIEGSPFASGYFCKGFLPKDLIGLELDKYERELKVR